jgi:hypothetical protein
MYTSFYIAENRLNQLKSFIRAELPTARFKHNPLMIGMEYSISLDLSVEDGNKLSQLREKWYNEDNPPKSPKKSIWKQILSVFN